MHYSLYQLTWFFIIYAFIGWVIGTSIAALRKKKFIDVGALFGPLTVPLTDWAACVLPFFCQN